MFDAVIFEREAVDKRFGDRLDGEQLLAIADVELLPIGGDDARCRTSADRLWLVRECSRRLCHR